MSVIKIVVSGSCASGEVVTDLADKLAGRGHRVVTVLWDEVRSLNGVRGWVRAKAQAEAMKAAELAKLDDEAILLCEGGVPDGWAFAGKRAYMAALKENHMTHVEARDGYDAAFLLTGADLAKDKTMLNAWAGQIHLRQIPADDDAAQGQDQLLTEALALLGDPEPLEIERKFLIGYPDVNILANTRACAAVEIRQTYLTARPGVTRRVRRRGRDGAYIYILTEKIRLSDMRREERERRISQAEYERLLKEADPNRREIRKTRVCLMWQRQYFEIDLFPFWSDQAMLEIELLREDQPVRLPPFIHMIKEVTSDGAFTNAALAGALNRLYSPMPMTGHMAHQIAAWQYRGDMSMYSFSQDEATLQELLSGQYYACSMDGNTPDGYFCYGQSARIPTDDYAYDDAALDMGLGLRPALCGRGLGEDFVRAGMAFARQKLGAARLRLSVASFNARAIKAYERAGFRPVASVTHKQSGMDFTVMISDC